MILGEIGAAAAAAAAAAADAETFSITAAAAAADDDDDVDEPSGLWMTGARRLSDVPSARLTRLSHPYRQPDTLVSRPDRFPDHHSFVLGLGHGHGDLVSFLV